MPRPDIQFDAEQHSYTVNGIAVPSVTQVIKDTVPIPFSAGAWYGYKMGAMAALGSPWQEYGDEDLHYEWCKERANPNRDVNSAGQRGSLVHDFLDGLAQGVEIVYGGAPPELQRRLDGIQKWLEENEPHFIESEVRTASIEHGYAGTLDAHVRFGAGDYEGATARIDYKTSKSVYPDQHFPQLAAYEWAERECGQAASDVQLVIHIPESGKVKMVQSTDTFQQFEVLLLHYMSNRIREHKKKIK